MDRELYDAIGEIAMIVDRAERQEEFNGIVQRFRDVEKSLGEIRLTLDAMLHRIERLERISYQSAKEHADKLTQRRGTYLGSVQADPYTTTATLDAHPEVLYTEG